MIRGERRDQLRDKDRREVVRTPGKLKKTLDVTYEAIRKAADAYVVRPKVMWVGVPEVGCMMLTDKSIKVLVGWDERDPASYRDATEEEKKKLDKFMNGGK